MRLDLVFPMWYNGYMIHVRKECEIENCKECCNHADLDGTFCLMCEQDVTGDLIDRAEYLMDTER